MTAESNPEVTIAVISHNGFNVVPACLESIFRQSYPRFRVTLVDNASTDGTPDWVRERYPAVEILHYPINGGPNPARNLAIRQSPNDLVLLVDDDAVLEDTCLAALVAAWRAYPDGAVWSPRICYFDQKDLIQFEGVFMHFVGEAILLNGDTPVKRGVADITPIDMAGGVSYLVSKTAAGAVGYFDESYFFGRTDGEFTFRLTLAGYPLYTVPDAVCYHRVKRRGTSKLFHQVQNRWRLILTTYSIRTLLLSAPALLIYELALVPFVIFKKEFGTYVKALGATFRKQEGIRRRRGEIQARKKAGDRQVLYAAPMNIRGDLIRNPLERVAKHIIDRFFILYWKMIFRFV